MQVERFVIFTGGDAATARNYLELSGGDMEVRFEASIMAQLEPEVCLTFESRSIECGAGRCEHVLRVFR